MRSPCTRLRHASERSRSSAPAPTTARSRGRSASREPPCATGVEDSVSNGRKRGSIHVRDAGGRHVRSPPRPMTTPSCRGSTSATDAWLPREGSSACGSQSTRSMRGSWTTPRRCCDAAFHTPASRARRPTAARPSSSLCTAATCRACSHSTAGGRSTSGRWRSRGGSGPSSGSPRGPSSAAASGSTVRLRQPDGALRLSLIRVLQPLAGHPRRLCRDVRPRRRRASAVRPPHPDLSPRERRDDAPPGWFEGVALR